MMESKPCWIDFYERGKFTECDCNYEKDCRECERMKENDMDICEECTTCKWYWLNNDCENECEGSTNPCHEYIEMNGEEHE